MDYKKIEIEKKIIADLIYYYEVDIDNCLMTHKDWIKEIANALTDKEYLSKLKEEVKEYKDERNA
tara:strand:+ start:949 stop:1143 length:195 start_codon:yes stop_codon:yes gene_type:complete